MCRSSYCDHLPYWSCKESPSSSYLIETVYIGSLWINDYVCEHIRSTYIGELNLGLVSWCSDQIEVQSRILSWYSHLNVFSRISTDHKIVTNGVYRNLIISKHHKSHKHILTIIALYLIFGNVHDQLRFDISSISNISHNSGNLSLHMMKTELRHKTFL